MLRSFYFRRTPTGWTVAACLWLLIGWTLLGCSRRDDQESDPQAAPQGEGSADLSTSRLGQVAPVLGDVGEFNLIDQNGEAFGSQQLEGKVWVATFIFTRCSATCPQQSSWMSRLQERLQQEPTWNSIRLVSFSVDPQYDTPEVLQEYAQAYQADGGHWRFLTGEREDIWQLSKQSFRFPVADNPQGEMPITHDPRMVLVDRQGRIRGYFDVLAEGGLDSLLQSLSHVLPEFSPEQSLWPHDSDSSVTHLAQPPEILDTLSWMRERHRQQTEMLADSSVFHDFRFTDRIDQSGITYRNQIVEEQRSRLQVNHYDHGTGICVADVDGNGLPDLFFVNQAGDNALYRNLGGGKFEDITERAGVALSNRIKVAAAFADVNNDGLPDLFVTTVRGGNVLFLNRGEGRFEDVTEQYGVGYVGHSSAAVFFDYDRDGYLDLFVCNIGRYTTDELVPIRRDRTTELPEEGISYYAGIKAAFGGHLKEELSEASILYRNIGGERFEDVTEQMGLVELGWNGAAVPFDANDDGWPDLYVLNMQGHDSYWENRQGQSFVDRSREFFPNTPWGTMGAQVLDFNQDGRFDLFLTDMHSDMSEDVGPGQEKQKANMQWPEAFLRSEGRSIFGNALFRNDGGGRFTEISDQVGAENYWPWGLSVGDLNGNGFEDVFIASSMCFPYRYGANSLLLNDGGQRLIDSECPLGVEPQQGPLIAPWFELDCSGQDASNPICRQRDDSIVVWSAVGSRSSVLVDIDDDGDLDIVTNDFNTRPRLLLSDREAQNPSLRYLKIKLTGTASNRDALGAVVSVTIGERVLHQRHDGQSGYLSQSSMPLYFGLDGAEKVETVEIHWPSGKRQTLDGPIDANQLLEVVEP